MKNKIGMLLVICIILLPVLLVGCSTKVQQPPKNANIAIVETSTFEKYSYLKLYNKDGTKIDEIEVKCTDINAWNTTPVKNGNSMFMNSIGGYSTRSDKVVELNLLDGQVQLHKIVTGTWSLDATERSIFTTNCPVGGAMIYKYDRPEKKVISSIQVPGCVEHMRVYDKKIYAFADADEEDTDGVMDTVLLYKLDPETMSVIKTSKISPAKFVTSSAQVGNNIFL